MSKFIEAVKDTAIGAAINLVILGALFGFTLICLSSNAGPIIAASCCFLFLSYMAGQAYKEYRK